ncbi:MAG: tetratricopeptide repeat protein [Clostridiales Family XIII bacterium]|nr:tetratricopeptide repeat protein [Clostridiales Family XIII bacterium]
MRLKDRKALEIALSRPPEETQITRRPDRVKKFLIGRMKEFVFNDIPEDRRREAGIPDSFRGAPIPLCEEDLHDIKEGRGVKADMIAKNMAYVIGIDPQFRFMAQYADFLETVLGSRATEKIASKGRAFEDVEQLEDACIMYRASLVLDFKNRLGMYGYARTLYTMYSKGGSTDYVGTLKAESFEFFEMLTEFYPRFDGGWYFVGYMYLNQGLYAKARFAWQRFLEESRDEKDKKEIRDRIRQIEEPVHIESGYNAALAGRWDEAIETLEPYRESVYNDWWPLWYSLGVSYMETWRYEDAIIAFKDALKGNPRHVPSMEQLVKAYVELEDEVNAKKYEEKIKLVSKKKLFSSQSS